MKRFLIAASCLSLMAPAIAAAQDDHQDKHEHETHQSKPAGGQQGGGQSGYRPGGGQNRPGNPGGGGNYQPAYRPGPNYGGQQNNGRPNATESYRRAPNSNEQNRRGPTYGGQAQGQYRGQYQGQYQGQYRRGRNYRGERRYGEWNGQRYRAEAWRWPRGYHYRRWWIGGILPAFFLSQAYWFDDYADLGFDAPPYGYEWVRYGPDLLLVSIDTGQIADVEYGVFY